MYFMLGATLQRSRVIDVVKSKLMAFFRPFLTGDKANVASLYLFCNASIVVLLTDWGIYVENVSYSIIAAVIFQYFVFIIPKEKTKTVDANRLLSAMRTMRQRDMVLFEALGYEEPKLILKMSESEKQEFRARYMEKVSNNSPVGVIKCMRFGHQENAIEQSCGGKTFTLNPDCEFTLLLLFLLTEDAKSIDLINQSKIDLFEEIDRLIGYVEQSHQLLGLELEEIYQSATVRKDHFGRFVFNFEAYTHNKQKLLLEYQRSAFNYLHEHDESYISKFL